jgi:hypothetical protein
VKEKLTEEGYCERTEIFLPAIKDLQDQDVLVKKEVDFPELSRILESLMNLLTEILDFVAPFEGDSSFLTMARKMIMNLDVQTEMRNKLDSFNARIHEIIFFLIPDHMNWIDFEDVKVTIQPMVDRVLKDMTDHSLDIVYLKALVNELIANSLKQETETMSKLLDLQKTLDSIGQPKQEDVIREVTLLYNALSASYQVDPQALYAVSPNLVLHCCWYRWYIPVELRMVIGQYVMLKTELSPASTYEGHSGAVSALVISESDNRLFSASLDKTIKVWNIFSKTCIATLRGHVRAVSCLCLYTQRHWLLSGSRDETIKVWDVETWQCVVTLEGHTATVLSLVLDQNVHRLYSAGLDNAIIVWDLNTLTRVHTLQRHDSWSNCLCLSPRSNRLFSGSSDNNIEVWNTISYECEFTMEGHEDSVFSLCLSEDGSRLFSGSQDMTIKIWDTNTNTCIATLEDIDTVTSFCLSCKTNRLISASAWDQVIRVWDTTTNTCIHTVADSNNIGSLVLSDTSDTMYSSGTIFTNCSIKSWRLTHRWE